MNDMTCTDFTRTFARTTGARFHANSRLPGQYPVGTALHARIEEVVARDFKEFVEVGAAAHERRRRKFLKTNELKTQVFGACGLRIPHSENEVKELATVGPRHWVRVPKDPLQRLKDKPPIRLRTKSGQYSLKTWICARQLRRCTLPLCFHNILMSIIMRRS